MIYQLVMDDFGAEVIIGYFSNEDDANDTLTIIKSLKFETMDHDPNVRMRCFKIGDNRFLDQGATFYLRGLVVNDHKLNIKPMTIKDYMESEAVNDKPMAEKEVDTSDLC